MNTPHIKWLAKKGQYSSGSAGIVGKIRAFSTSWDAVRGNKSDKPWVLHTTLPGFKEDNWRFATEDEAKDEAVKLLAVWLKSFITLN